MRNKFAIALVAGLLAAPLTAKAQVEEMPSVDSAADEAEEAAITAEQAPGFHEHVMREHRSSHSYDNPVRVGEILPPEGFTYYEFPAEYKRPHQRYTVINHHVVLVNPRTRKIVQVLD
jgi:hypothetical protein